MKFLPNNIEGLDTSELNPQGEIPVEETESSLYPDDVLAPENVEQLSDQPLTAEEAATWESEFAAKTEKLTELIKADPDKYYRVIAEIYVLLMMFEASMRSMMMNGGPKSIFKMLIGRK